MVEAIGILQKRISMLSNILLDDYESNIELVGDAPEFLDILYDQFLDAAQLGGLSKLVYDSKTSQYLAPGEITFELYLAEADRILQWRIDQDIPENFWRGEITSKKKQELIDFCKWCQAAIKSYKKPGIKAYI